MHFENSGGGDKRGCDASFAAHQLGVVIDEGRAVSVGGWRLSPFWWEAVFSDVTGLPSGLLPALVGGFDLSRWPCASWGRGSLRLVRGVFPRSSKGCLGCCVRRSSFLILSQLVVVDLYTIFLPLASLGNG